MKKCITLTFSPQELETIVGHKLTLRYGEFKSEDGTLTEEECLKLLKGYVKTMHQNKHLTLNTRFYTDSVAPEFRSSVDLYGEVVIPLPSIVVYV